MTEADGYPWNASRKRLREFENNSENDGIPRLLPPELSSSQIRKLFQRNRPREYFMADMIDHIKVHGSCRDDLRERIGMMLINRQNGIYCLADALAAHPSSASDDLGWLCELGLQEDEVRDGGENLVDRWKVSGSVACQSCISRLLEARRENEQILKEIRHALSLRKRPGARDRSTLGGKRKVSAGKKLTPALKAELSMDYDRTVTASVRELCEPRRWPWNGSRRALEKFETDGIIWSYRPVLPYRLSSEALARLYRKHSPREYVSYALLAQIISHPACPLDVVEETWAFIRRMLYDVSVLVSGAASMECLPAETVLQACCDSNARRMLLNGVQALTKRWSETGEGESYTVLKTLAEELSTSSAWSWAEGLNLEHKPGPGHWKRC